MPNVADGFQEEYIQMLKKRLSALDMESVSSIGASIGIAIFPDDGHHFEALVQQADASMYRMKEEKS